MLRKSFVTASHSLALLREKLAHSVGVSSRRLHSGEREKIDGIMGPHMGGREE